MSLHYLEIHAGPVRRGLRPFERNVSSPGLRPEASLLMYSHAASEDDAQIAKRLREPLSGTPCRALPESHIDTGRRLPAFPLTALDFTRRRERFSHKSGLPTYVQLNPGSGGAISVTWWQWLSLGRAAVEQAPTAVSRAILDRRRARIGGRNGDVSVGFFIFVVPDEQKNTRSSSVSKGKSVRCAGFDTKHPSGHHDLSPQRIRLFVQLAASG